MVSDVSGVPGPRGSGWLVCLLLATFVIGTDDFVIAGVLPAIADDLEVSEAAAGQLVTVFSVTYALAAPPLAVVTARLPRKALLVGGLSVFAVVNLLTALAPGYALLMVMRVVTALVAATITPAAFAIAGRMAEPERVGRAMGVVAAGLTVSLFVGVPVGTLLGDVFGWRSTFVAVGLLTLSVAVASGYFLPRLPGAPEIGVRQQVRILARPAVMLCVAGTVFGASSGLMIYTYIAPVTEDLAGRSGAVLALFIGVVGVAGAVGTFVCGRLTDRWGADRVLLVTFGGVLAATGVLAVIGGVGGGDAPVWLVAVTLAGWGFAGWGFNPPMNTRALQLAGDAGTEAVALNTSGLYVGIAVAGGVGGAAVAAWDGTGVAVASAVIGLAAFTLMAASIHRYPTTTPEPTPTPAPAPEPAS
ncbi:MFS transporter [Streptomyces johnsoniae]|uniref:MFS transporter n=1 Tax=Streptomyces johnsoniae TaxID=3075532 RepID=A0ABU2S5E3_9ACTN|nr:MFS transporter [Streptomyces sp. DSM 41886]MDT0444203.1 MFS transporter [Streptomyces sp. DSM 41886]